MRLRLKSGVEDAVGTAARKRAAQNEAGLVALAKASAQIALDPSLDERETLGNLRLPSGLKQRNLRAISKGSQSTTRANSEMTSYRENPS